MPLPDSTREQADTAQGQQVLEADLGLALRAGAKQVVRREGVVEGEVCQGKVLAIHQCCPPAVDPSSGVGSSSVRIARPEAGGDALSSVLKAPVRRCRLTWQLA